MLCQKKRLFLELNHHGLRLQRLLRSLDRDLLLSRPRLLSDFCRPRPRPRSLDLDLPLCLSLLLLLVNDTTAVAYYADQNKNKFSRTSVCLACDLSTGTCSVCVYRGLSILTVLSISTCFYLHVGRGPLILTCSCLCQNLVISICSCTGGNQHRSRGCVAGCDNTSAYRGYALCLGPFALGLVIRVRWCCRWLGLLVGMGLLCSQSAL